MRAAKLILLLILLPTMGSQALPYLEISRLDINARNFAFNKDLIAIQNEELLLMGKPLNISGCKLLGGRDIFIQCGGSLLKLPELREVARCEGCSFIPYSEDRYAILKDGLTLRIDGRERKFDLRPRIAKWSKDGNFLVVVDRDEAILLSEDGMSIRARLNTQIFDVDLSGRIMCVATKDCEVFAFSESGVAWTNKLCSCCIPLKLSSSDGLFFVALQGKEIAVLNSESGRVLQRIEVPGYSIYSFDGIVASLNSNGTLHIFADLSKLRVEGKSYGILLSWDIPEWLRGELNYELNGSSGRVEVSRESFIPVGSSGSFKLKLKDLNGLEIERDVNLSDLEVKLSPDGLVEVRGEGKIGISAQGKIYNGTRASVDTGFLPFYEVTILNYGKPIATYRCYNSRFTVISLLAILLIAIILRKFLGKMASA
jgi:hypothetical protein